MKKKLLFSLLFLFLLSFSCIPVFASITHSSYPYVNSQNIPDGVSDQKWIVVTDSSGVHLYSCGASSARYTYNGTSIKLSVNTYSTLYKYTYSNGVFNLVSDDGFATSTTITAVSINQAGVDVYNSDGTVFFPVPPLLTQILDLLEREIPALLPAVIGDLKTLALCGVGLAALLIGLSLLSKKSLIFLHL